MPGAPRRAGRPLDRAGLVRRGRPRAHGGRRARGRARRVTLLEEPQAAFYSWLAASGDSWRRQLGPGDMVLVCDIGGGTTDFSLIAATDDGEGNLELERVAVGEHILLGGDNMDLTLAHLVTQRWRQGQEAQARRSSAPWSTPAAGPRSSCSRRPARQGRHHDARPRLQADRRHPQDRADPRNDVETWCSTASSPGSIGRPRPQKRRAVGLRELGLPYATDPGITRHLAAFLASTAGRRPRSCGTAAS
jgi:hypothetical protein